MTIKSNEVESNGILWKTLETKIVSPKSFEIYSNDHFKPNRSGKHQIVSTLVFFRHREKEIWYYGQYNFEKDSWSIHDGMGSNMTFDDDHIAYWFYPPEQIWERCDEKK